MLSEAATSEAQSRRSRSIPTVTATASVLYRRSTPDPPLYPCIEFSFTMFLLSQPTQEGNPWDESWDSSSSPLC